MVVGTLRLRLFMRQCHSLKEKRQVIQKIRDRIRNRFDVAIAEVGENDFWETGVMGVAAVGNDAPFVQSILDNVERAIEGLYVAEIIGRESEVTHLGKTDFPFIERD